MRALQCLLYSFFAAMSIITAVNAQRVGELTVSLQESDVDVSVVLTKLFKQAGVKYRLLNVPRTKITVSLKSAPIAIALQSILATARTSSRRLTYEVKSGTYVVHPVAVAVNRTQAKPPHTKSK